MISGWVYCNLDITDLNNRNCLIVKCMLGTVNLANCYIVHGKLIMDMGFKVSTITLNHGHDHFTSNPLRIKPSMYNLLMHKMHIYTLLC